MSDELAKVEAIAAQGEVDVIEVPGYAIAYLELAWQIQYGEAMPDDVIITTLPDYQSACKQYCDLYRRKSIPISRSVLESSVDYGWTGGVEVARTFSAEVRQQELLKIKTKLAKILSDWHESDTSSYVAFEVPPQLKLAMSLPQLGNGEI